MSCWAYVNTVRKYNITTGITIYELLQHLILTTLIIHFQTAKIVYSDVLCTRSKLSKGLLLFAHIIQFSVFTWCTFSPVAYRLWMSTETARMKNISFKYFITVLNQYLNWSESILCIGTRHTTSIHFTLHICIDQNRENETRTFINTRSASRVALRYTTSVWYNDRFSLVIVFTFKSLFFQLKYITLKKDPWLVSAVNGQLVMAKYRYIRGNVNIFVLCFFLVRHINRMTVWVVINYKYNSQNILKHI